MAEGMGNSQHFAKGSEEPDKPAKDVIRVYGMKICPYVHRLKLVLSAKGVKHETVNINLRRKPEWYTKNVNPRGLVPTLELNGERIFESDITSVFVDETYPGRKLMTSDPLKKAKEFMLLGDYGKVISGYYKSAFVADPEQRGPGYKLLKEGLEVLENFFEKNGGPFVGGNEPDFMDYMIWPHLERVVAWAPDYVNERPRIRAYVDAMGNDSAVKMCRWSDEVHRKFFENVQVKDINFDYDSVGKASA